MTQIEWYMVGCESNNVYQKEQCWKEVELHAEVVLTILDVIVNIIEADLYDGLLL